MNKEKLHPLEVEQAFKNLDPEMLSDSFFMTAFVYYKLGIRISTRKLRLDRKTISSAFGGLLCKQMPNELAKYLIFIYNNRNKINNYLEIGCERAGTFGCRHVHIGFVPVVDRSASAIPLHA